MEYFSNDIFLLGLSCGILFSVLFITTFILLSRTKLFSPLFKTIHNLFYFDTLIDDSFDFKVNDNKNKKLFFNLYKREGITKTWYFWLNNDKNDIQLKQGKRINDKFFIFLD